MPEKPSSEETLGALKRIGVTLPRHPQRALEYASNMGDMLHRLDSNPLGKHLERTASMGAGGIAASTQMAIPRYFDPNTNFGDGRGTSIIDTSNSEMRMRLHQYCRLFYATHPIIGACIDIYSRFPVVGMEFTCEDKELERFYTELFVEDLEYEDFFIDMGKEYWTVGESFPLGAWDEDLGIWVSEELLSPDDVNVSSAPLSKERVFHLKPSEYMKTLIRTKEPRQEYEIFCRDFADLVPFIEKGLEIPVSNEVLSHVARKNNSRDVRGTPILTRGIKVLMLEDRIDSSMQAIADRMYAPLTLFKLGMDFGDGRTWIPTPDQLDGFRTELDLALASDFRAMVTHFAIESNQVFGTESMPRYSADRNFIDERLFMLFGLTSDILKGTSSQPYASSALRIEFVNQMLSSYQSILKKHWRKRALVVAEAQGHYASEKKGKSRIPIYEEFLVVDDKGNKKIEKRPKLLIPEMKLRTMNLRDEAAERDFLLKLEEAGVPVAKRDLMVGIPFSFEDSLKKKQEEDIMLAVSAAETTEIVAKTMAARGFVIKSVDPLTGAPVYTTEEASDFEAEQAVAAPPAAAAAPTKGDAGKKDDPKAKDTKKTDDKAKDDKSATGGGARPNVSDEKKKGAPKKKARVEEENEAGDKILVDQLFQPVEKVRRSMVAHAYDPEIDGAGSDESESESGVVDE